jgi:3-hydroxymyristoyl/3-hydroxydecanoyl-(acyl carrier protein) dehydratase
MNQPDIHSYLPYGPEFLFIDRMLSHSPNGEIVTEKTFHATAPLLRAHFLGGPAVVPGVLLVEMASQSALFSALLTGKMAAGSRMLIGSIRATFHNQAPGGCVVTARVTVDDPAGGFAYKAELTSNGIVLARVQGIGMALKESVAQSEE